MKKLKLNSGKLNLYKKKISSLSDNEKGSIIGGNDTIDTNFLSIFNCNTKTNKCPTNSTLQPSNPTDTGSRNPPCCWSDKGHVDCDIMYPSINP